MRESTREGTFENKAYLTKQQARVLAQELVQFHHLASDTSVWIMIVGKRVTIMYQNRPPACFLVLPLPFFFLFTPSRLHSLTYPKTGNSLPSLRTTRASTVSRLTCKLPFCFFPRPRLVTLARFIMAEVASAAVAPGAVASSPPPPPPFLPFPPSGRNSTRAIVTLSCRQACNAAFSSAVQ